jgi:hypothetical protein
MGDLDGFPAAPRRPRAGAWLRRGWLLGVVAALVTTPTLVAALWLIANGRDVLPLGDDALDAECSRTSATVTDCHPDGFLGGRGHRIAFRFALAGGESVHGVSFAEPSAERPSTGQEVQVEFLPHAPEVARIAGTHRAPPWSPFAWWFRAAALPGLFLLGVYVRAAFQQRILLTHGRLTLARVLTQEPVLLAYPPQRRVTFEFEDENRTSHRGCHWVGLHTPLGARLESDVSTLPVIHDSIRPRTNRLAHRSDFLT